MCYTHIHAGKTLRPLKQNKCIFEKKKKAPDYVLSIFIFFAGTILITSSEKVSSFLWERTLSEPVWGSCTSCSRIQSSHLVHLINRYKSLRVLHIFRYTSYDKWFMSEMKIALSHPQPKCEAAPIDEEVRLTAGLQVYS